MSVDPWSTPDGLAALRAGDFGAMIRAYRKYTGASQTTVAAKTGLAQSDVSQVENGIRKVTSASVQKRILDGLQVPIHLRDVTGVTAPEPKGTRSNADYDEAQALVFRLVAAPPGQRENVRAGAVRTQADRLLGIDSVH